MKNGQNGDRWLRWTACYRKTNGRWLIVHEHVSVPVGAKQQGDARSKTMNVGEDGSAKQCRKFGPRVIFLVSGRSIERGHGAV